MKKRRILVALGALSAALAGCSADSTPGALGSGGSSAISGGAGMSSAAGTGGSSNPGGSAGAGANGEACVPGIPATTQLRRMLNRQYDAVVRDLLGVTTVAGRRRQGAVGARCTPTSTAR